MIVLRKMLQHYGKLKMIKINLETIKNNALYKSEKYSIRLIKYQPISIKVKFILVGCIYAVN